MDTRTLRPRQFRMINTGSQQSLGTAHSSQRTVQIFSHLFTGFMSAVGQVSFSMSPHLLHRVQFRRIARKSIDMQTRLLGQERFNFPTPVNFTTIPNDEYMAPQMVQQLSQEGNDLSSCDIVGMESSVESQSSAPRRNGQNADDRYLVSPVAVPQDRGLANGSPCSTDVGNQQKATLVKKTHMGPKSFGLFLYAAKPALSTVGFYPHPVAMHASQASGNSNSVPGATTSTHPRTCNELHTVFQPVSLSVSRSTTLWHAQPPRPPSIISLADRSFVPASGNLDAPSEQSFSIPSSLFSDEFGSTGPRCSRTRPLHRPRPGKFFPCATKPRPYTYATPTVHGFHVVSCQHNSRYPLNVKDQ